MPTKNFFLSHPLLASAHSPYQFLYQTCKTPLYPVTSTSLNYTFLNLGSSSSTTLNCRTLQATCNGMSSGLCGHLRHLSHLSHISYLSTISNLNTLNPYLLNTALADSYYEAFITEMDPKDLGPLEGYFVDNLLNLLPTATSLLLTRSYIRQTALNGHSFLWRENPILDR
jgi:hypothetical protein